MIVVHASLWPALGLFLLASDLLILRLRSVLGSTKGATVKLNDCVAVVTGASRNGGRGIALALGDAGATVYVTGRSIRGAPTTGEPGETIDDTAEQVTVRGGQGIPVRVDHTDDSQVAALFAQIQEEQGRLDLLVNNAPLGSYDQGRAPLAYDQRALFRSADAAA
jgi:NAD(P)-dependent dehydrogenase (short-subunit alcohol dehydrogenase family)